MSEKSFDKLDEKIRRGVWVVPVFLAIGGAGLILGDIAANLSSRRLSDRLFSHIADGHVYEIWRRNDGVWEVRSTGRWYTVSPSCAPVQGL